MIVSLGRTADRGGSAPLVDRFSESSPLSGRGRGRVVLSGAAGSGCGFFRIGWKIEFRSRIRYRLVFLRMAQHVAGSNSATGVGDRIKAPLNTSKSTCNARINRVDNAIYCAGHD
jgi:hypothetical protein